MPANPRGALAPERDAALAPVRDAALAPARGPLGSLVHTWGHLASAPARHVRSRFQAWWQARLPLTDQLTLTQRNVYILPTRAGWMLVVTLMVLLVSSINYQLNLGYLLTFLLAGCAVAGMHVAHGNLRGLQLQLLAPEPCHAGTTALWRVRLTNPARRPRYAIAVRALPSHDGPSHRADEPWVWTDVGAQGLADITVGQAAPVRGLHRVPALTAQTLYPLGAFRVWTVWRPAAQMWVYPAPEKPSPPLPMGSADTADGPLAARTLVGDDFEGVRPYRPGDPMRQVVWKKYARSGELVSRDQTRAVAGRLWLDWSAAGGADVEQRLSRLCAWVLSAELQRIDYGLRLPGVELAPNQGPAHCQACLQALARW
jgi:uncharacterized protein (DUF58 family)